MSPSPPKPPAPPPPPPTIDQAAQEADAANLIRRRRGYAATVLTQPGNVPQTQLGTKSLLGGSNLGGANP